MGTGANGAAAGTGTASASCETGVTNQPTAADLAAAVGIIDAPVGIPG